MEKLATTNERSKIKMADKRNTISYRIWRYRLFQLGHRKQQCQELQRYASAEAKTNAKFAKIMEKAGGNLKDLQKEIAGLATSVSAVDQYQTMKLKLKEQLEQFSR